MHHLIKEQQKEHADILTTDARLCEKLNPSSWPPETLQAEIRTTIPGLSETALRSLTLVDIDKHCTAASSTHIYTDESAENASRNGGCGTYIKPPRWPSGKAPASRAENTGFKSRLHRDFFRGRVIPVTPKLVLQWLPCQAPGVIGSSLELVGPVSVYCDWVR